MTTQVAAPAATPPAMKLFISYSRSDKLAALEVVRALELQGFDVFIDLERLEFGEQWRRQLSASIAGADTVLWLVSPASVTSRWCQWELHEVERFGRRLLPLRLATIDPESLPPALSRVHMLPAEGLLHLPTHLPWVLQTLYTDGAWIRQGTALLERARQWRPAAEGTTPPGTDASALLVGAQLRQADQWLQRQPPRAPAPPSEVVELILVSREAERRRRAWGLAASLGAVAIAATALWQWDAARQRRIEALANQSRQLLAAAQQALDGGDAVRAVLLVLEALPDPQRLDDRPLLPEAEARLYAALQAMRTERLLKDPAGHTLGVMPAAPPAAVPVLGQDHVLRLLDVRSGAWGPKQRGPEALPVRVGWSAAGRRLLVVSAGGGALQPRAYLWDTAFPRLIGSLNGHEQEVRSSAFSGDGRRLAMSDDDGFVTVHDTTDGKMLRRWKHGARVHALAWDKRAHWLAGADDNGLVVLWDASTGRAKHKQAGCVAQGLYMIADDRELLVVCSDGWVRRRAVPVTGAALVKDSCSLPDLRLHTRIDASALVGQHLLTGDEFGVVTHWNLAAGRCSGNGLDRARLSAPVRELDGDEASRTLVAYLRDEPRGQSAKGTLQIWQDGTAPEAVDGHPGLAGLALVADGATLVTHGGSEIRVRDRLTTAQRGLLGSHSGWVSEVSVAGVGDRVLSHGLDAAARLWDPYGPRAVAALDGGGTHVLASAFSSDGSTAYLLSNGGRLTRWQAQDGAPLGGQQLSGPALPTGAQFGPGASRLLVARGAHAGELWEPASGRRIALLGASAAAAAPASAVLEQSVAWSAFSADGRWLVTGAQWRLPMPREQASAADTSQSFVLQREAGVNLWDAQTGDWVRRIDTAGAQVRTSALSADGKRLAIGVDGGRVLAFSLPDGRQLGDRQMPEASGAPVWSGLTFSPDGSQLAASYRGAAVVWSTDGDNNPPIALKRGLTAVGVPQFTPDSRRLVTRDGRTLRLWDLTSGDTVAVLEGHRLTVSTMAVDPQGRWLLSGSLDRDMRRWPLDASRQALLARAWGSVPRCLTREERAEMSLPAGGRPCAVQAAASR